MKMSEIKTMVFGAIAVVFFVNALIITATSHFNFGHFLMWGIAIASSGYSLFNKKIDLLTASGFGLFFKIAFCIGFLFFLAMLGRVLWGQFGNAPTGEEKTVVILGCGVRGETPSYMLQKRLDAGFKFYEEHQDVTIVVCGGQGEGEYITEALAMQRYLVAKGVPEEQIIMEDKSASTEENLTLAVPLLKQKGISPKVPTVVVTSDFHCARGNLYAKQAGFEKPTAIGAKTPLTQILPAYLREAFAMAFYTVFR